MTDSPPYVAIPWQELSETALRGIIEAFIGREGTDYGVREVTWESKVEDVLRQLRRDEARIVFDPATESVNIISAEQLARIERGR